jgi:hypothetical protein
MSRGISLRFALLIACVLALPVAASGQTDTPPPTSSLATLCTKATEGTGIQCTVLSSRSGTATITYGGPSDTASEADFGARPSNFAVTGGRSSGFTIPTRDDTDYENDETLSVKITFGTAVGRATVTVVDNEVHPGIAPGRLELISRSATGGPADGASGRPELSDTGRIVAFDSLATNMLPAAADLTTANAATESDTNNVSDVYSDDRQTPGGPIRVSVSDKQATGSDPVEREREGNGPSFVSSTTEQHVGFLSDAGNLISKETNGIYDRNGLRDAFRHETGPHVPSNIWRLGTNRYGYIEYGNNGAFTRGENNGPAVAFFMYTPSYPVLVSRATNLYLAPGLPPGAYFSTARCEAYCPMTLFGRDVDVDAGVGFDAITGGDRMMAWSDATKFRIAHQRTGTDSVGVLPALQYTDPAAPDYAAAKLRNPAVATSRLVAFTTAAGNFSTTPEDGNGVDDVYGIPLETLSMKPIEPLSLSSNEDLGNRASDNADVGGLQGRFVVFESDATNLVPRDINGKRDIFLRDREAGTTELISATTAGRQLTGDSFNPQISDDGNTIAFETAATNVDVAPGNSVNDVVVRVRTGTLAPAAAIGGPASSVKGAFRVIPKRGLPKLAAPRSTSFSLIPDPRRVPVDTLIDARGRARVQVRSGKASALAGGGQFQLAKTKRLSLLRLVGGREKTICGARPKAALRRLAVTARGRIGIVAGTATARPVRGPASFVVTERCNGVEVAVSNGRVRARGSGRIRVIRLPR